MKQKLLLLIIFLLVLTLRFYQIDKNPPGLYIDEVSSGYNGYTILTKGVDEHGKKYPLWFEAFGEYKMPALIYSISASMAFFGKNEFAVRFPSALLGTMTVVILYFILDTLINKKKSEMKYIPLISSVLLAISPWHIQFSRGGFDATLALFFYLLGLLLFLFYYSQKKLYQLLLSLFFLVLTLYSYNGYRIVAPVTIMMILGFVYFAKQHKKRTHAIISLLLVGLASIPFLQFSFSQEGLVRFSQTSAFTEIPTNSNLEKILLYPMVYLKNYISYFSFYFLFIFGDGIGRHQMPRWGLFFKWELLFLLLGIYYFIRNLSQQKFLSYGIIFLLSITPVAAALTTPSPHSLRSLLLVVPLTILISFGIVFLASKFIKLKKLILIPILLFAVYESILYLHAYYYHYPKVNLYDWGAGAKEVVEKAKKYEEKDYVIVVDDNFAHFRIYFDFYGMKKRPLFIGSDWAIPNELEGKPILFIRPSYGKNPEENVLETIYVPNQNNDIFAYFYKLQ